jgi:hypothetical protein
MAHSTHGSGYTLRVCKQLTLSLLIVIVQTFLPTSVSTAQTSTNKSVNATLKKINITSSISCGDEFWNTAGICGASNLIQNLRMTCKAAYFWVGTTEYLRAIGAFKRSVKTCPAVFNIPADSAGRIVITAEIVRPRDSAVVIATAQTCVEAATTNKEIVMNLLHNNDSPISCKMAPGTATVEINGKLQQRNSQPIGCGDVKAEWSSARGLTGLGKLTRLTPSRDRCFFNLANVPLGESIKIRLSGAIDTIVIGKNLVSVSGERVVCLYGSGYGGSSCAIRY